MLHDNQLEIRFFKPNELDWASVKWPIQRTNSAEELVNDLLDSLKVGPLYRMLFGLRISDKNVWLSPNFKLTDLQKYNHLEWLKLKRSDYLPPLELRVRFRPALLKRMMDLDKNSFEILFSQMRYDFIHDKLYFRNRSLDRKRDFLILNESVQLCIVLDILRHSLQHDLDIDQIFEHVKLTQFVPRFASSWQSLLLNIFGDILHLKSSLSIARKKCKDVMQAKITYMKTFSEHFRKDYWSEMYESVSSNIDGTAINIRSVFNEIDKSYCKFEIAPLDRDEDMKWMYLCDIYTVCYGTCKEVMVELNRSNGHPFRIEFPSPWHAESFISLIDGYYRLTRKWYFNFCPLVTSPSLKSIMENKIHGPIGLEAMKSKLTRQRKPGSYLIRMCMDHCHRYLIDVLLLSKTWLTICVDYDPNEKCFTKQAHETSVQGYHVIVIVILKEEKYINLKSLLQDIQIEEKHPQTLYPTLQLRYLIKPGEYDDCPALLLSMPKDKLKQVLNEAPWKKRISQLPKIIPPAILELQYNSLSWSGNKMAIRTARLHSDLPVIVKDHEDHVGKKPDKLSTEGKIRLPFVLNYNSSKHGKTESLGNYKVEQIRLADWIFVKHPIFAEAIGVDPARCSLIQQWFRFGPLDAYLLKQNTLREEIKRDVPCQLARALLYLQEEQIIHGKIRCRNIVISSLRPFCVKITDPLGFIDAYADRAFLPPEIHPNCNKLSGDETLIYDIGDYDSGIDVWAFGTTLWQLYSKGIMPDPGVFANTLQQPVECSDRVWQLMELCWLVDFNSRITPQIIFRDLNDYFAWAKPAHIYHDITEISEVPPQATSTSSSANTTTDSPVTSSTIVNGQNGNSNKPMTGSIGKYCGNSTRNDKQTAYKKLFYIDWKVKLFPSKQKSDGGSAKTTLSQFAEDSSSMDTTKSNNSEAELSKPDDYLPEHWNIDKARLKIGCEIGRGSCGLVKKAFLTTLGEHPVVDVVAVKYINDRSSDEYNQRLEDLDREFRILTSLNHVNVIRTFGMVRGDPIMVVFEHLPLGSLLYYLKNTHDYAISLPLRDYARGIASGMEYLESKHVIHRDLAARNILLKNHNEVKICDFGLAHSLGKEDYYRVKSNERALPIRWCAPETLKKWEFNHKTDVWSYGVVIWEIYSGGSNPQYPGTLKDLQVTLEQNKRLPKPNQCPNEIYELMLSCWAYEPEDRLTFTQICDRLGRNYTPGDGYENTNFC